MGFEDDSTEDHWIPLADLMTGMAIIFMLVAVSFMLKIMHREITMENQYKQLQISTASKKEIKQQIVKDLNQALRSKLASWHATIESQNLSVKFNSSKVMFDTGKSNVKLEFANNLAEFFPLYFKVLKNYESNIMVVSVDGYASSIWGQKESVEGAYFLNMQLSQQRATNVLRYLHQFVANEPQLLKYVREHFTANGYSSSSAIFNVDGSENYTQSQRVEFKIVLKE